MLQDTCAGPWSVGIWLLPHQRRLRGDQNAQTEISVLLVELYKSCGRIESGEESGLGL